MGIFFDIFFKSNIFNTFELKSSELVRLLKKDGWIIVRQNGSHMIMEHPIKKGMVVCPYHGSQEIGRGLEKKIKKDAGIK
jgi:mRNA interferase HicA